MPDLGDELGWRSPHHNARPNATQPVLVVLHCDAGKSDLGTLRWLCDPTSKVSYHVLIGRDGVAYQVVDPKRRAWHAGVSEWEGRPNVNDFSLGLCFANRHDHTEMLTGAQISVGKAVIQAWAAAFPIEAVTTHAAIAPTRKTDPLDAPNFWLPEFAEALREAHG